jgi:hypothetical protein
MRGGSRVTLDLRDSLRTLAKLLPRDMLEPLANFGRRGDAEAPLERDGHGPRGVPPILGAP